MIEQAKLERLSTYLDENGLASVWFATPSLFAWLTGGRNLVAREGATGVAAAGYDGETVRVITTNIEAQRLVDEEVDDDVTVESVPWHEASVAEVVAERAPRPAAADFACDAFDRIDRTELTQPLTDRDRERYRLLSQEAATVVESVARDATPENTERELAADLHRGLQAVGMESPVVLVGGEERVQRYRHFPPQPTEVGGYAVLTVVAVKNGLNAAVTRTVAFDDEPDWLEGRYGDVCRVAATMVAATQQVGREGGTAGDVFEHVRTAYEELGYPGEWEHHHQGGALGTAGREWVATPQGDEPIRLPMAYGWNPTISGAKTEDTILIGEDEVEVLSDTGEFPRRTVSAVGFDTELTVPDLFER